MHRTPDKVTFLVLCESQYKSGLPGFLVLQRIPHLPMSPHRIDRTELRRSALVSLDLGMAIELKWSSKLGGGRKAFSPEADDSGR